MGNFPSTLKTKRILQTRLPLRLWELRLIHRGVQLLIKNFTQSKEPSYINSPFLRSTGLSFLSTLLPFLLIKYTALLSALLPFLVPLLTSVIDYLTSFLSTDYLNKKPSFKASPLVWNCIPRLPPQFKPYCILNLPLLPLSVLMASKPVQWTRASQLTE